MKASDGGEGCVVWLRREVRGGQRTSVLCGCGRGVGVPGREPSKEASGGSDGSVAVRCGAVAVWLCGLLGLLGV